MKIKQKTVKQAIEFNGIGVHSGVVSSIKVLPAAHHSGITFYHKSFPDEQIKVGAIVPENALNATVVKQQHWSVSTIEHLMAAIWILDLDNLDIEIDGSEIPIFDGSAFPFVQGILRSGIQEQEADKLFLMPRSELIFQDAQERMIKIVPPQKNEQGIYEKSLFIEYGSKFDHPLAGNSTLQGIISVDFFIKEIAPARTFGLLEQLPFLRKHGLAQGTTLGNTVVLGSEGFMNEVRFSDEFVRHKLLDLLGDLSLLGKRLIGAVYAYKTGHNFNKKVIEHFIHNPHLWEIIA
jgi:UDP-3-O-[3-hydroxymyristoyl] N-acetylglucosamine deacetylase